VVWAGFSRLQSSTALSGLVHIVSPLVFAFCITSKFAWSVFVCSMIIVLRPCVFSWSVWAALIGFWVSANCSSYRCGMISESMSLVGSDSKWCLCWSWVLSCW
jgi:hypothetical protein